VQQRWPPRCRIRGSPDFEAASLLLDRIRALSAVQGHQTSTFRGIVDADGIAPIMPAVQTASSFFLSRAVKLGHRAYFPSHDRQLAVEEVPDRVVASSYDTRG